MEHEKGGGDGQKEITYENMPPGKEGEIWIRGGTITQGYLNNREANEESFVFDKKYTKGPNANLHWFKTGGELSCFRMRISHSPYTSPLLADIGHIRPDGHMFIVDRRKELLKYKGFQIAPAELEDIVLGHPAVLDAGVIGIYDDSQATELVSLGILLASRRLLLTASFSPVHTSSSARTPRCPTKNWRRIFKSTWRSTLSSTRNFAEACGSLMSFPRGTSARLLVLERMLIDLSFVRLQAIGQDSAP